ncbi:DUF4148 domain-containing protein [Ramlibacter sp. AN1133]|uniref:DUF4148 domain-containing protein n=1 Tax=Ramlibacter sp. AN1133 TaxID=3133429 RepID=UPI0030BAAD00
MNRYAAALLAVSAAALCGQVLAETPTAVPEQPFVSVKSRVDVQAELAQYKQAGVNPWSMHYNPLRAFKSNTSREAVTADYIAARDQVAAFTGEDSGAGYLAANRSRVPAATKLASQGDAIVR